MPQNALICVRRGTESELFHIKLSIGELGFTTDTHKLFIGSDEGNLLLAKGKSKNFLDPCQDDENL